MLTFDTVYQEMKAIFNAAKHIIYLSCDTTAQELLKKAGGCGDLCVDKPSDDPTRELLKETVLTIIAKRNIQKL